MTETRTGPITLDQHPAWRNPDASAEDIEDLQRICPHLPSRYYVIGRMDWIGCCDCGKTLRDADD